MKSGCHGQSDRVMNNHLRERGNALVETAALMLVMLPVVFAMALMGNLIDLKQTTEQAARYVAWESTVETESSESISVPLVNNRFYESADNPIQSLAIPQSVNSLWGNQTNDPVAMSSTFKLEVNSDSLNVNSGQYNSVPSPAMRVGQAIGQSGKLLQGISGNSWGLTANGVSSSSVGVVIEDTEWIPKTGNDCFDSAHLTCLSSRSAILNDSWSASGDEQAAQRIRSLMPATVLQPLGRAVSVVGKLPLFDELKDLRGAFGHIDMSVLPEYEKR